MTYRPYKFLIVPVLQEVDDGGEVVQELQQENPTPVFGIAGLHRYADSFELELVNNAPVPVAIDASANGADLAQRAAPR